MPTAAGFVALSIVLQAGACPQLQHLDIGGNGAGEAGIMALRSALNARACTPALWMLISALQTGAYPLLRHLGIGGNEGGEALIMALTHLRWRLRHRSDPSTTRSGLWALLYGTMRMSSHLCILKTKNKKKLRT